MVKNMVQTKGPQTQSAPNTKEHRKSRKSQIQQQKSNETF